MKEYKTVAFGCVFNTIDTFNRKLQELLDEYSEEGWILHSMQVAGASASFCVCIFEKEKEEQVNKLIM